ncbi:MAG: hypothetical protein RL760_793 [Candidatus Eisenbacteria bacterium]
MASSNGTRWRIACDHCDAAAWTGADPAGARAWCEACQTGQPLTADARCPDCSATLPAEPRFLELWGGLQQLDAVLMAWAGDARPLATLLPERPRFVTDLDPPARQEGDAPELVAILEACAHGDLRAVLAAPSLAHPRAHAARAIALERRHEREAAVAEWDAVIAASDDARARLARGALHALAGRWSAAEVDLAHAGDSFAARWDRASLVMHRAIVERDAFPSEAELAAARAETGPASSYWSDPTVGRLVWSLVIERTLAGRAAPLGASEPHTHARVRRAEATFEHATFWDRAMQVVGWWRLGAASEVARTAVPLAETPAAEVLAEPALAGPALGDVAAALHAVRAALAAGDVSSARRELAPAMARPDLPRFRIPCRHCGQGTVGVDAVEEPDDLEG